MPVTKVNKKVELLPAQFKFLSSTKREILFSSGYGGGKSMAGCYAIVRQACIPNNVCVIIRKTLTSLKRSTLLTLIGGSNPVLPQGSYTYKKADGVIDINGKGSIYLLGMDDENRIRSMNLGAVFIDEVSEFTEQEYMEVLYRLRLQYGSRQLFCATNPANPSHWLYKRFFAEKNDDREVITASSLDNTYLPEDYLKSLKDMNGSLYRRYVLGEWVALDDLVFSGFSRDIHVKKLPKEYAYEEYYLSCDWGQTHPSAILLVGKIRDRLFVLEEFCKSDPSIDKLKSIIKSYYDKYPGLTCLYDPSAKVLHNELSNIGVNLNKANNDVSVGIDRIRSKLLVRNDAPDLIVNETCVNLIREFECYQYKPNSEIVKKINDDCLDALRYVVNEVSDVKESVSTPTVYFGDDE